MSTSVSNVRPQPDKVLIDIADYVMDYRISSELAYETARYCLIDSLGCGLEALEYPECTKLLGPIVPGTIVPNGARVPGTRFELDPVQAAFNIGAMIRWLDFNDTWLAPRGGHPSGKLRGGLPGGAVPVGPPVGQSRRDSRGGGLPGAQRRHVGQDPTERARGADRHDQGARDPGGAC